MATAPTVILPIKADPRGFIEFARVVARHMTALADDLDQLTAPEPETVHYSPAGDGCTACGQWLFAATADLLPVTCKKCRADEAYRADVREFREWQRAARAAANAE